MSFDHIISCKILNEGLIVTRHIDCRISNCNFDAFLKNVRRIDSRIMHAIAEIPQQRHLAAIM